MSQHHLTVFSAEGATIHLTAGYDPRLRKLFLSLRDTRLPEPGSAEEAPAELAEALRYDSYAEGLGLRKIGDVEARLEENGIPFDTDYHPGAERNPKLLKLLVEIMLEQENDEEGSGRKVKMWDAEPDPVPSGD